MSDLPTLKRSMNLLTLTFYGLGTIIGAGIYVLIGEVAGVAGSYMPLSFLLAGLIAAFTALSYAELASRFPVSAGEAVYVKKAWNRNWLSGLTGWMIVLTGIVSAAAISNGFAGYLNVFIDLEAHWAIILLCIALCGIAVYGINLSASAVFIITLLELAGLAYVVWIAAGMERIPDQTDLSILPEASSINGIFVGAFLAFYAFIGFEDMVNVIEEVKNPLRNFPIAVILAIVLSLLCYLGVSYMVLQVSSAASLAQSEAPLADLVVRAGADPGFIGVVSLLAVVNGALVQIIMASRVMYGMAKINLAPAMLGNVNAWTRTPIIASVVVSLLVLGFALLLPLVSLARLTSLIMLVVFVTVNIALIVIKHKQKDSAVRVHVPIFIPYLGAISSFLLVAYQIQSLLE
ncbi:MAG: amino acid transporter [SAR86 cluster bacterium]|uniref:Amino acid transporter n=1 Tax=SAR86 cluster bacterium TaxID=2030880 RepID=A0A2A5CDC3_9GAMM|nr:amino acid permease [Gammaproteobacteria bacterium AH-315-E17]PCJ41515.1 MAG: amino acid transporter [SAR86 cluster bacterium]